MSNQQALDECEFTSRGRPCERPAVATLTMPPNAPNATRRCCQEHGERFVAIGEQVKWNDGRDR